MKWGGHPRPPRATPEFNLLAPMDSPPKKPEVSLSLNIALFLPKKTNLFIRALCSATFEAGQRAKTKFSMLSPRRKMKLEHSYYKLRSRLAQKVELAIKTKLGEV